MIENSARERLSRKLLLGAASMLVALVVAELGTRAWLLATGRTYSAARAGDAVRQTVAEVTGLLPGLEPEGVEPESSPGTEGQKRKARPYALHPYTGFAGGVGAEIEERVVHQFEQGRHADRYTVFVLGGSVAAIFSGMRMGGTELLEARIAADATSEGRKVKTFRLATAGFKQPQQLLQLTYLLSRGCAPDLVINLDGLNEVRLGESNGARGVQPTWPSLDHWASVATAGGSLDQAGLDRLIETRALQVRARAVGETALARGYTRSAILGELTLSRLTRIRSAWARAQEAYVDHRTARGRAGGSHLGFGPAAERQGALQETLRCWFESSLAMHQLCAARGIRYVHALQPTLHDEGSKPITDEERRAGIGAGGFDPVVAEGYPLLRTGIARLREEGVEAYDLTRAFAEVRETLYYDDCHFRRPGNLLLADRLADAIGLAPAPRGQGR